MFEIRNIGLHFTKPTKVLKKPEISQINKDTNIHESVSIRPFNTFSIIDLLIVIRGVYWLPWLNWIGVWKILFDMYDQRQSLLIVNIVIYLIKTIKDLLIEEKMIHF